MYLAHERRTYILRLLETRGSLRSATLAQELGVTDETIRTDLVQLQAEGLLKRVHGGALYIPPTPTLTPQEHQRLDVQLAQIIAAHIPTGSRIFLADPPLATALAASLREKPCTFITPTPALITQLSPPALPHRIISTGGELDKTSAILRPESPTTTLRDLAPDLALLSPPAVTPRSVSYPQPATAAWVQALVTLSIPCLIAVPSIALHQQAHITIPLSPHLLATEDNLPSNFTEQLPPGILHTVPYITRPSQETNDDWEF